MYTIDSLLPIFAERVYFSVIGRYIYVTNKSGSKQGLFGKDVIRIIQYVENAAGEQKTFRDLFADLSLPETIYEAVYSVMQALHDKGFFDSPTETVRFFGPDEEIYRIISAECCQFPTPLFVNIELTTACNLQCAHCYNTNDKVFLPLEAVRKKLAELRVLGTLFVGLSGGEPLLHPDIKEIISCCDELGMIVQILSNATLMNDDLAAFFCEKSVQVVKVSLYSLSEEQHNRITRQNSFHRTYDNILKYKDRIPFAVSCPITRWNTDVIPALQEWAKQLRVPVNFSLGIVAKSDCSKDNLESRMTLEQYKTCLAALDITSEHDVYPPENKRRLCSAGCSSLALDAEGDVLLCPLLKSVKFSQKDESIGDTWRHCDKLQAIRALTRDAMERCVGCEHQQKCHICLADNFNETGDLLCVPEEVCEQRKVKFSL